ncbi:MAG: DUF6671 family protein [Gammaproteobacteria bacterium]
MFQGKEILLATMHQKELAIQPEFERHFGCKIILPQNYDTDQFGTFCGEKKRYMTAREMVVHKAKTASQQYGYPLSMATEASFGAHPIIPLMPFHEEFMVFLNTTDNIEIIVKKQTNQTNYGFAEFEKGDDYSFFLFTHSFPSHALIVRTLSTNEVIAKGINSVDKLNTALEAAFKSSPRVRLETDMRALFNPTRMQIIRELTLDLINRIESSCPRCSTYGFGEIHVTGHLPCSDCGFDTTLYQNIIEKCVRCDYHISKPRGDKLYRADPAYCNHCNP